MSHVPELLPESTVSEILACVLDNRSRQYSSREFSLTYQDLGGQASRVCVRRYDLVTATLHDKGYNVQADVVASHEVYRGIDAEIEAQGNEEYEC